MEQEQDNMIRSRLLTVSRVKGIDTLVESSTAIGADLRCTHAAKTPFDKYFC